MAMNTKSGISWHSKSVVKLPNGRRFHVASRKDADDFVDTVGTDFISTNLNTTDVRELEVAYLIIILFVGYASTEKTAAGFPESELRFFVQHIRGTLKILSSDLNWLRSGTVSFCHEQLLNAVAGFSRHPSFLKVFIANEGMEVVANFYASRKKNDTPNVSVAHSIIVFVGNVHTILGQEGASFDKVFGTIEKAGLLGQLIRCIPVDPDFSANVVSCC
jgi:hypothetical protein